MAVSFKNLLLALFWFGLKERFEREALFLVLCYFDGEGGFYYYTSVGSASPSCGFSQEVATCVDHAPAENSRFVAFLRSLKRTAGHKKNAGGV